MKKERACRFSKAKYYRTQRYYVFCVVHDTPVAICGDARGANRIVRDSHEEMADCRRDFL